MVTSTPPCVGPCGGTSLSNCGTTLALLPDPPYDDCCCCSRSCSDDDGAGSGCCSSGKKVWMDDGSASPNRQDGSLSSLGVGKAVKLSRTERAPGSANNGWPRSDDPLSETDPRRDGAGVFKAVEAKDSVLCRLLLLTSVGSISDRTRFRPFCIELLWSSVIRIGGETPLAIIMPWSFLAVKWILQKFLKLEKRQYELRTILDLPKAELFIVVSAIARNACRQNGIARAEVQHRATVEKQDPILFRNIINDGTVLHLVLVLIAILWPFSSFALLKFIYFMSTSIFLKYEWNITSRWMHPAQTLTGAFGLVAQATRASKYRILDSSDNSIRPRSMAVFWALRFRRERANKRSGSFRYGHDDTFVAPAEVNNWIHSRICVSTLDLLGAPITRICSLHKQESRYSSFEMLTLQKRKDVGTRLPILVEHSLSWVCATVVSSLATKSDDDGELLLFTGYHRDSSIAWNVFDRTALCSMVSGQFESRKVAFCIYHRSGRSRAVIT